jgi:membrane fusion protein, heavy metal efflux system
MREDSVEKNIAEAPTDQPSVVAGSIEHTHRRFRSSPARVLLVAALALLLVALVAYLLWPRQEKVKIAVETPPTLEATHEGDEHDEHSQEGAVEVSDETAELVGIKTEKVVSGEIEDTIATVGKALVAPNGQAIVGAKVDGRAVRVMAEPGQNVRAGQVLVIVDSPQIAELRGQLLEVQARLRLAEQNLARTNKSENRAAVIQAKNKLDFAQNNLERKQRLAKLGAAAGREVAEAEVEFKNAKAEYDYVSSIQVTREQQQAVSELEQSRAVAARLVQSLAALGAGASGKGGEVSITSPIAGTVIDRHVSLGQAITQGSELMTVMNLSSVIIEALLPESHAIRVQAGQRMFARLPGLPDQLFEGQIDSVGKAVDPEKRTVPVRARITNAGAILKHEMAVEARIVTGVRKEGLLVPVSALVEDEGIKVVYVKEGVRYERRPVKVGTINYQVAEILSGIEEGEEVVTAGAYQLKNMQKGGSEEGGHHDDH